MNTLELLEALKVDLTKVKLNTWHTKLYKFRRGYTSHQGKYKFKYEPFLIFGIDYTKDFNGMINYTESALTKIIEFSRKRKCLEK